MGTRYILDSNAVIYLIKGELAILTPAVITEAGLAPAQISVISKIELLGWNPPSKADSDQYQEFVSNAEILPLTDEIIEKTIEFRRLPGKPKIPDCIIAATAVVHGLTLISRNESDFLKIPGLTFVNPFAPA